MYFEEHIGYVQIGKELNISGETVKSWLHRYRIKQGLTKPRGSSEQRITVKMRAEASAEQRNERQTMRAQEKRIRQLEMQVELLRAFLCEEERRLIQE